MKKMGNKGRKRVLPSLVSAMLMASGLFQLATPLLALTAGGQQIDNTATAEYDNDNNPGNGTINSTSNTVSITVAEVAGITVSAQPIQDQNGGSVNTNDTLLFDYVVTNVGNDPTQFFLPGQTNVTAVGANVTAVEVISVNGTALGTAVPIPAAGADTATLAVGNAGSFNPGDNLTVRVTATVAETVAGNEISVRYGNTGVNNPTTNNGPDTQNQPDNGDTPPPTGPNPDDVRTVDNANPATFTPGGEVIGTPVNGEREAAGFQSTTLAAQVRPLALATILKTRGTVNNSGTLNAVNDDIIPYNLQLNVSAGNVGSFTAGNLEGTNIELSPNADGTAAVVAERVLISDAIPAGTVLTGTPIAPVNWQVVYSTSALPDPNATPTPTPGTIPVDGIAGTTAAIWQTVPPADLTTVTRVGFIYDATANGPLNAGASVTGFQFQVVTSGLPATGGQVANIAQVFGQTQGDATNEIVYDESGDQNPNNFSEDANGIPTTPPDATGTAYNPTPDDDSGIADPATDGVDANNNNTGLDNNPVDPSGIAGGEANVINLGPNASGILNGPQNVPGAIGPVNNNDDFTNQSLTNTPQFDAGVIAAPNLVTFTNTVQNPTAGNLDNVELEPLAPSAAQTATTNNPTNPGITNQFGADEDIPDGTRVTITANGVSAVYVYTAPAGATPGSFDLDTTVPGNAQLNVGTLTPGQSLNYTVDVQLPPNVNQNDEIPIPIVAFPEDTIPANGFDATQATDTVFNITVDRVYTGYLQLVKRARLLAADGITELQPFSADPFNSVADTTATPNDGEPVWTQGPQPGEIIEYQVTYTNISTPAPAGGNGNVVLNANSVVISENGTGSTVVSNNWALDANGDLVIDTSNIVGTAVATQGTVQFFSGATGTTAATDQRGNTQATDVTAYTNTAGIVIPQGTGTFTFRRQLPAQ